MNKAIAARKKAVSSALGSLRAENMTPNKNTQILLKRYSDGKITAKQLKSQAIELSRSIVK